MRQLLCIVTLLLTAAASAESFIGSQRCANCHRQAFADWQGSHHDLAMQLPGAGTVLGDFDNASFAYHGVTTRFFRRGDDYFVSTDGPDGKISEFPVRYVFGVYPLQQYLLPLPGGRLQALSIAWDARPAEQGGQRWYHLYADEQVDHDDPLHWTGPYQNWNTRCAECHSTNVRKNYDASTRTFNTRYDAIDVGCEACHGPGEQHQALAFRGGLFSSQDKGFANLFAQRGRWFYPEGEAIARRRQAPQSNAQIDMCGRCHARRSTLGDYHYGADLLDTHRLAVLQPGLYHADGQILDEVYVYGSFVQSKMHMAGVVCSNCHEPHSQQLRAPGNGVCAQCHKTEVYDAPAHHRHTAKSAGAQCANCHMPGKVYMGVDYRRDHSMRIPRPDLSIVLGTPNACTDCHSEKSAQWALDALRDWGKAPAAAANHPARELARLRAGDARVASAVSDQLGDAALSPIWRATAVEALGASGAGDIVASAQPLLTSPDAVLRSSAVRSLQSVPLQQRFSLLMPLVDDPVTGVRMEVAAALAPLPLPELREADADALRQLFGEYQAIQSKHADMPAVQLQQAAFYNDRGEAENAEKAYREALRLNPQLLAAHLNLADLLRSTGREAEAREQLALASSIAPQNADVLHATGLLEIRAGNRDRALELLAAAAGAGDGSLRHRFVYAIALHDLGQLEAARVELRSLNRAAPGNPQVLLALVNYAREMGDLSAALRHARELAAVEPENPSYQRMVQQLAGQIDAG